MLNFKRSQMKASNQLPFLVAILFICTSLGTVRAQSLRIVYDFIKDDVTYYRTKPGDKKGKEISSPIVGRNKMVQVEVVNFNKFVYTASSTFTSQKVEEQSDMSLMNIISPLVMPAGSGSFFTTMGGTLPTEIGRGGLLSMEDASSAYDDMNVAFRTMNELENNIKSMDYAIRKLNSLRYNAYLPTDTIVELADHLVETIFKKPTVRQSDFTDAIVAFNTSYSKASASLSASSLRFLNAYGEYDSNTEGDFEGKGMDKMVRQFRTAVVDPSIGIDPDVMTARIDLLETIYTSIKSNNFAFNASHAAKDDEVELLLKFFQNPASTDSTGPALANLTDESLLALVKDKKINIIVRGDMKINTSIGLGFPKFSSSEEFFNKDSVITSQSGSSYSPNLAAYINFYPYTGRIANLGGTFGIGVPLNDPNRNVNMLMGAVALFGSKNRVAIHGGLTLGQVKKLDEGFAVGDYLLSATQVVPTRNNWEWGGFVGISFNLVRAAETQ
jgi:hypothetical protein